MKHLILIIILLIFISGTISCYYDNAEFLYPEVNNNCDTSLVTFSGNVIPMLQNSCWSCHANNVAPSFGGNIRLQDYADISVQSDRVLGAIKHLSGYSAMPKNGGSVDGCEIRQFEIWIASGKPEN